MEVLPAIKLLPLTSTFSISVVDNAIKTKPLRMRLIPACSATEASKKIWCVADLSTNLLESEQQLRLPAFSLSANQKLQVHSRILNLSMLTLYKAPPTNCSRRQFQILLLFQKYKIMFDISQESSVCWQTILLIYHTLFFSKIGKNVHISKAIVCYRDLRFKG